MPQPSNKRHMYRLVVITALVMATTPVYAHEWVLSTHSWPQPTIGNAEDPEAITRKLHHAIYIHEHSRGENVFAYIHQPLLIRDSDPAHNGYLHQFSARLLRDWRSWHIDIGAGVHGSSNMFKHADFHREALVMDVGLSHIVDLGVIEQVGVKGDYRFGNFQLYPRITGRHRLFNNSELLFDLPLALLWRSVDQHWQLGFERYGEKWGALDAERELKSAIYLHEWRFGGWKRLPLFGNTFLKTGAGISFDTRIRYTDLELGPVKRQLGSTHFATLAIGASW